MRLAFTAVLLCISSLANAKPVTWVCTDITREILSPEFEGETMKTRNITYDVATKEGSVDTLFGTKPAKITGIKKGGVIYDPEATVVSIEIPLNVSYKGKTVLVETVDIDLSSGQASGFYKTGPEMTDARISTISSCRKK